MVSRRKIHIMVLLLYMLLSSCNSIKANSTVSPPAVEVTVPENSAVPVLGGTLPPQRTMTPFVYPTITLVPALPVIEAEAKVIELLHNNGGCRFPCFWGFTPSESNVQVAHSVLHSFLNIAPDDFIFDEMGGGVGFVIQRESLQYSPHIIVEGDRDTQSTVIRYMRLDFSAYQEVENVYGYADVFDSPLYTQYFQYYTLPYLLSNYGKPTNVYINFENDVGFHEYYLFLDYTESGWVAMLKMPLIQEGDLLISCPTQAFTRLWLWSPDDTETAKEYGFVGSSMLKSIEEATSLSLDEFYQQYKDPINTKCLQTPADIYTK